MESLPSTTDTLGRDLVDTKRAAQLIGVSPATVRRWAKDGRLDSVILPSGRRRFDRSTILRALSSRGGWAA